MTTRLMGLLIVIAGLSVTAGAAHAFDGPPMSVGPELFVDPADLPPAVTPPAAPPAVPSDPSAKASRYYCANPKGYYPDVSRCPDGWARVPASPNSQ